MNSSQRQPAPKKLAGSKINIDGTVYKFCDTPLARATGGLYSACEVFGLSDCELLAMFELVLNSRNRDRMAATQKRGLPPDFKRGMDGLIARGWVADAGKVYGLLNTPETTAILASVAQAIKFGESEGRA